MSDKLASGHGTGQYPHKSDALGWAMPWGVPYGGMTGGNEIHLYTGVDVLEAREPAGYRHLQLVHRMQTDRQPTALYHKDGEPTRLPLWVQGSGADAHVPMTFYMELYPGNDPFGFKSAPNQQPTFLGKPPYEQELLSYAAHDLQHLIRYTRSAKALAWIGNDALAKDDLRMQAELVRLSYHMYPKSPGGYAVETGMLYDRRYIDEHPGAGFRIGRGEGWGIDAVNAAYALAEPEWRAQARPFFEDLVELVVDGQASCSGFLQSNIQPKFLDGKYRARQSIEQAILENALWGVRSSVFLGDDPAATAMLEDVLIDSFYAFCSDMAFSEELRGPWTYSAVGPLDESLPAWCDFLPPDGHTSIIDGFQVWSSFAYAHELTGDPHFLHRAETMLGGELLQELLGDGMENLENRMALLQYAQALALQ